MANWVTTYPNAASMVLVGALVVALFEAINSLLPVYVREVLHTDPTLSVYIFAPAGVGFIIGTILSPLLIRLVGERWVSALSFFFIAGGAILFGCIHLIAPYIAQYSPLRVVEVARVSLPETVLAAGLIAVPFNFGSTAASSSVQAWLNRYVPLERQGRTFGMQEVIEQALTITALLSLGAIGTLIGTQFVFLVAPLVVITVGVWFIRYSYRASGTEPPIIRETARSLVMGRGVGDPDIESRKGRADDLARERALEPVNPQRPPTPKKPRKPLPRS
jgi:MFS family permease